jgi:hypothetical protein
MRPNAGTSSRQPAQAGQLEVRAWRRAPRRPRSIAPAVRTTAGGALDCITPITQPSPARHPRRCRRRPARAFRSRRPSRTSEIMKAAIGRRASDKPRATGGPTGRRESEKTRQLDPRRHLASRPGAQPVGRDRPHQEPPECSLRSDILSGMNDTETLHALDSRREPARPAGVRPAERGDEDPHAARRPPVPEIPAHRPRPRPQPGQGRRAGAGRAKIPRSTRR